MHFVCIMGPDGGWVRFWRDLGSGSLSPVWKGDPGIQFNPNNWMGFACVSEGYCTCFNKWYYRLPQGISSPLYWPFGGHA